MESRGPEDSKKCNNLRLIFLKGSSHFFEDFSLTTWLYLVFIDGLLYELENAKIGCTIGGIFFGATMQADDLSLLSLAKSDMDKMLNICNYYSKRWRYELNPSKPNILVFRESKQTQKRLSKERDWSISNSPIVENITGKHVGVLLQCDMKSTERTLSACRRLRSTFMSIIGIGANLISCTLLQQNAYTSQSASPVPCSDAKYEDLYHTRK